MIDRTTLRAVVTDQRFIKLPEPLFEREAYSQLQALQAPSHIVVISGIRRSGKSTLLQQIRHSLPEKDFYLNFDDDRLLAFEVSDFQTLLEVFIELYGDQRIVFFDEIQNVPEWERFIRRLHDYGYKIYLTGSNSNMLSKELGTRLTGRYLQITVYPLSFKEFLNIDHASLLGGELFSTVEKGLVQGLFTKYCEVGGMPEYIRNPLKDVLHILYQNILYRDIIVRYQLPNEKPIKELMYYIASNVSKDVSFNALKSVIGVKSASTVSEYCVYLEDSYLIFLINRFDASLRKQIQYVKKGYIIDPALAQTIGFRVSADFGRMLENIVFLELKRKNLEIYFHRTEKECDFLIREGLQIREAIQVCQCFSSEDTKQREIAGLVDAMSCYNLESGLILTEDFFGSEKLTIEGKTFNIIIQPIWAWMLGL